MIENNLERCFLHHFFGSSIKCYWEKKIPFTVQNVPFIKASATDNLDKKNLEKVETKFD